PATSNTISKIAHGIDDTPITTFAATALSHMPVVIAPAMHESMYAHPFVSQNLTALKQAGVVMVGPKIEEGKAKIASTGHIVLEVERVCAAHELEGVRAVVSAGATAEPWDDVRVLTSRASGRTGRLIALELYRRGAQVVLVHPERMDCPPIAQRIAHTTREMLDACVEECEKGCDVFVASAAVSDYAPARMKGKVPSGMEDMSIRLKPTPKVLERVVEVAPKAVLVGFKAETHASDAELERCAKELKMRYGLSIVVANDISKGGMGTPDNRVLIVGEGTRAVEGEKDKIAHEIVDEIVRELEREGDGGADRGEDTRSHR
ncbi:MAG: bifunctional phosphopantothenoylcysteine decarboxylase/phosphopantothenate--cysteine ligase CoaBC, partial [Methermicoccaceae archaeon]